MSLRSLEATMSNAGDPDEARSAVRDGLFHRFVFGGFSLIAAIVAGATILAANAAGWGGSPAIVVSIAASAGIAIAAPLFLIVRKWSHRQILLQDRLRLQKTRINKVLNSMRQGLISYDADERVVIVNRPYIDLYRLSEEVTKPGVTVRDVIAHRCAAGTMFRDPEGYLALLRSNAHVKRSEVLETDDGRSIQVIHEPLADGGSVATHDDITEQRRAEQHVLHLAHYDALTDLPNRTLFRERLEEELAHIPPEQRIAVHHIDIDGFKSVNDSLGLAIGDELLKSVAANLSRCIGKSGLVARLGADEFAIVQTGISATDEVRELIDNIFDAIRMPLECQGHQLTTDASIGTALAPDHGSDADQVLKKADLAMHAAKSAGGGDWRSFDPAVDARIQARRQLEADLREAISRGALEIHYEPCVTLQDGRITACEAQIRWRHPVRGVIPPTEFMDLAEESGLIDQLGEWMLSKSCAEAASWPPEVKLTANISPEQFRSGTLAPKITAALAASGLPAKRLELEIAETVLMRLDDAALGVLRQLRDIGVGIALDGFGGGYSSLSCLQRFPFDKIKIDRSLIKDIGEPDGPQNIVQAVTGVAAARKITTTAEGVETETQRQLLRKLGCSEMQGPLLGSAIPAAEIVEMIAACRPGSPAPSDQGRKRRPLKKPA
jgi:diguanylate cyclase (GGDEF)-like protein